MKTLIPLCLVAAYALADVGQRNGGAYLGPVRDINCIADAGVVCSRNSAVARGDLGCATATTTGKGCLDPAANPQSLGGDKAWTGSQRLVGVAHSSLEACSSGAKGTWQTCTTHNAPVFCNGTTNLEFSSPTNVEQVLMSIHVDGVPIGLVMTTTTLSGAGATVTALENTWVSGTTLDAGVLTINITDGSNVCACSIPCSGPSSRTPCTGSCTYAAGATLTPTRIPTSGCTADPVVPGNMLVMGTRQ